MSDKVKDLLKNKKVLIGIVAAVVVIGLVGAFMLMQTSDSETAPEVIVEAPEEVTEETPAEVTEETPAEVMELIDVRLGLFQGLGFAPSFIAETQGLDTTNGLNVEHVFIGPRDVVTAVLAGEVDMILTVWPTVFTLAANTGEHLVVVGNHGFEGLVDGRLYDSARVMVPIDSDINTIADLAGKTIGVINPTGLNANGMRVVLLNAGVNLSDVTFERIFYGAMGSSLASNAIDAAVVVSPFNLVILKEGLARNLVDADGVTINPHMAIAEKVPVTAIFTTQAYFEEHPEAVKRMAAMNAEAVEWMNANPEEAIAALA
ncbi:MAG: ABC transporter substrate-binding protein, partial [Nitrosopumilus sp.]